MRLQFERTRASGAWAQHPKRASCTPNRHPTSWASPGPLPSYPVPERRERPPHLQAHGGALTQGPTPPSGLLRLEELVRGFLISKETLSVRMLDDSRDPTPLLKEIRDDKVSTIIIDANASISHLILRKVGPHLISPLWWVPT